MNLKAELRRWKMKSQRGTYLQHMRYLLRFCSWRRRSLSECPPASHAPDVTVIIPSYRRPQNIDTMIRLALKAPSVRRVLVSNNNPDVPLADWVSVKDPRVEIIKQARHQPVHQRFGQAMREQSDLFVCIDDDLFLSPTNLEALIGALNKDPSRPHGFFGQTFDHAAGTFTHNVMGETVVDSVNRVYAFTKDHAREFFRLVDALGFTPVHPHWAWGGGGFFDDLVISVSGSKKPKIHTLTSWMDCPTYDAVGIAMWKTHGFFAVRDDFYQSRLSPIKGLHP